VVKTVFNVFYCKKIKGNEPFALKVDIFLISCFNKNSLMV
jgi:hypothetical protein